MEIISFIDYVSHSSDLQHDQDRINHFLIHISLEHIPSLTEAVGELRAFGAAALIDQRISTKERVYITAFSNEIQVYVRDIDREFEHLLDDHGKLHDEIGAALHEVDTEVDIFLKLVDEQIIKPDGDHIHPVDFFANATTVLDSQYRLYGTMSPFLLKFLGEQKEALTKKLYVVFGSLSAGVFLVGLFGFSTIMTTSRRMRSAVKVANRIAMGDRGIKFDIGPNDEMGSLLESVDIMRGAIYMAQEDLRKSHVELETRVLERTKDLNRVNESLVVEIKRREELETEALKTQKLESLGVLAGGIAHDFNNILTGISGNIFLSKQYRSDDQKFEARYADLLEGVERASDLTKQLLTFASGGKPVKKICSVRDLVTKAANFALTGSNVESSYSFDENLYSVEADEGQMSQVINNIIINAKQSMPSGGMIYFGAENVEIKNGDALSLKAGEYVKFWIKDSGVGISAEALPKIFDPYFSTKEEGRGLGLASTHSIVQNHEGTISVESVPGVGTTFIVYLPAIQKLPPVTLPRQDSLVKRSGKILVMDDDAVIRDVTCMMLVRVGFRVDSVSRGEEALERYELALSRNPYDLVILDLTIPGGMGGKETMERLLELDPETSAIVISGYSKDPVLADFRSYGFKGRIAKPFMFEDLQRAIDEALAEDE